MMCVNNRPQNSQVVLGVPSLDESTPEQLVNLIQGFADEKHPGKCDYQRQGDDVVQHNTNTCRCTQQDESVAQCGG